MGDPVRAVRLLRGDPSSKIVTLSSDAGMPGPGEYLTPLARRFRSGCALSLSKWQALLLKTPAKAACNTVCSEPPDLSLTDAAVLILADDPPQTAGQWCADSSQ